VKRLNLSPNVLQLGFFRGLPLSYSAMSGVIGKSTKFGFEWKWPLMGKK
jgi:hypothetical protein